MKFILGTKQNMTQIFDDAGNVHPGTIISAGPISITQVKNTEKDGYVAAQVGYGTRNKKNINKAQQTLGTFRYIREFRPENGELAEKVGDTVSVSTFAPGDVIEVSAISKGKGFQGVVKRHGFKGGPRTHGQKHSEREPGGIGGGGRAGGRVAKNIRMAGRMGGDRVTVKNLTVLQIDPTENIMVVSGAVPGRRGTLVEIRGK